MDTGFMMGDNTVADGQPQTGAFSLVVVNLVRNGLEAMSGGGVVYISTCFELERANSIISEFLSLAKNKLVDLRLNDLNTIISAISPLLQADALLADKSIKLDLKDIPELLLDEKEIRQLGFLISCPIPAAISPMVFS